MLDTTRTRMNGYLHESEKLRENDIFFLIINKIIFTNLLVYGACLTAIFTVRVLQRESIT